MYCIKYCCTTTVFVVDADVLAKQQHYYEVYDAHRVNRIRFCVF
jgi:hypothetical protein